MITNNKAFKPDEKAPDAGSFFYFSITPPYAKILHISEFKMKNKSSSPVTFKSSTEKHRYVNDMFGRIAHRYDRMNRIMTGGQDMRWRKLLIQEAGLPEDGKLLDIATGTGDIAFEALKQHPDLAQVVAADFTLPMMHVGQARAANTVEAKQNLIWSGADALHLPFEA